MAKFTPSDKLKELQRSSDKHKDKLNAINKAKREAWNKGLVKMDMEIPHDLYVKIEALAQETKISTSQAFSIILTEQVKLWQEENERIRKVIADAIEEEYQRIAVPLELQIKRQEEFNKILLELFPAIKTRLHKKAHN
jgi:hypothetical protein